MEQYRSHVGIFRTVQLGAACDVTKEEQRICRTCALPARGFVWRLLLLWQPVVARFSGLAGDRKKARRLVFPGGGHATRRKGSSCVQRPVSAETTKSMSCKEDQNKKISYHAATNHNTRPSKASAADVGKYKSSAVAFMKTTNAWAVSEHLSKRKWDGFSETLILDHESLWLHLPDELWISIFSNLSHKDLANVAQVCQRFQYVANDDSLWNVIEITNCHSLNDDSLTNIGCHHPKSLTLYRCHDDIQCITNSGLESLFQNCKDSLTNLKMTNCSGSKFDGDTILLHASQHCRQLTNLDISWNGATDKGVIALVESSACLKSLSVNGCKITDRAIDALVKKHSKSLIKLEVFGCHALTARCLCLVATECTHLQTLNIGRVPKVTDMCLVKIASNLHKMTTLNVTGLNVVRDRTVHHIVKQCSKLENLTLSSCCQVTDVSLVEISTYLQTIKYLDLSGCKKVTDIGIQALARSCRQISYLDLSSTGTGKRGVCLLASYCYNSLECLKISFCMEVTSDAIEKLCNYCKRLKVLHLYGCRISPDLGHFKKFSEKFKIFHDLSIPAANIIGE
uniref:F-box domain-containing protein n=1 Tax=Leptobrachium leishanense TaxID=445787 RepID=A0A8C5PAC9_9ANUR